MALPVLQPAYRWAWFLAAVLTLLNAIKPAVVDDTAYLFFARHLAQHPGDPYGWLLFWNAVPQPAIEILMPPVLPYWLAVGMAVFGEHLFLLKLWLFPFSWLLCRATAWLVARFAPGQTVTGSIVIVLSPALLVLFNFMLDVPALALGTASVAALIWGCDHRRLWPVAGAGVLAGFAMQTKYSMLILPLVLMWYALLHRRWLEAFLAVAVAGVVFWGWEWWLVQKYGQSHFLFHVGGSSGESGRLADAIDTRVSLVQPLLGQFGGLMVGVSLWVAAGRRFKLAVVTAIVCASSLAPILFLPHGQWPSAAFTFQLFGLIILVNYSGAIRGLCRNVGFRDSVFLVGWVLLELVGTLGLSPFPAARRMLGVCFAMSLLGARAVSINGRSPHIAATVSVLFALGFFAVDCWDAQPEKVLAERAAEVARPEPGGTVWFSGHWGFQYYCDRAGMKPVLPGQSTLMPGDWLVYPEVPDDGGFYRPWHGGADFNIDAQCVESVMKFTWDDALRAQTIPNLYGGGVPIYNRDHPRLVLAVYRIVGRWSPERK